MAEWMADDSAGRLRGTKSGHALSSPQRLADCCRDPEPNKEELRLDHPELLTNAGNPHHPARGGSNQE